jgi:general secretion pathway protein D
MKTTTLFLILFLTGLGLRAQTPAIRQTPSRIPALPAVPADAPIAPTVPESVTAPLMAMPDQNPVAGSNGGTNEVAAYQYNFQGVDVSQVLDIYAGLVNRTLLHAGAVPGSIILKTQSPLTKSEAIQALEAVLAMNGISVVPIGEKFAKVVPSGEALGAGGAVNNADAADLPNLGSFETHIVQLKYVKPSEMITAITPFAKLNSIIPLESNGILIIRDYAENMKLMLDMIDRVDVSVPAVYISEVIPIKYALAEDIASALNSLGGSGGGNVSIGSSSGSTGGNGLRNIGNTTGGLGGAGGGAGYQNGARSVNGIGAPGSTPGGPAGGANSFQARLQSIIQKASGPGGQDQIQVFGQTKIIADQRANALLIFATRQDMDAITNVIAKLDVLLSQVLIESVIMEVSLDKNWNFGVSAIQNPSAINRSGSPNAPFNGIGGFNNGQPFFNFMTNGLVNLGTNSSTLANGLSYFGSIAGSDYDVAVQAAASDNSITIIQKPRIQTFQAQPASFFVGSTVPYVTSTYNGGTTGIGSSYSQLSVGVSLNVTPFINPDGLVVMQIDEEIDDISGYTTIDGNPVPNTASKKLSSNVAVKDRDSIILGGAIYSSKIKNKSGVPILEDIPLLGALFSSSSSDKSRQELLVLMRPTVLRTPELAAQQAKTEEGRLPGIALAESQDNKEEAKTVAAEKKLQQIQDDKDAKAAAKAAKKSGNPVPAAPAAITPDETSTPPVTAPANSVPNNAAPVTTQNPAAGLY